MTLAAAVAAAALAVEAAALAVEAAALAVEVVVAAVAAGMVVKTPCGMAVAAASGG